MDLYFISVFLVGLFLAVWSHLAAFIIGDWIA